MVEDITTAASSIPLEEGKDFTYLLDMPEDQALREISQLSVRDKMDAMKTLFNHLHNKMVHKVRGSEAPLTT